MTKDARRDSNIMEWGKSKIKMQHIEKRLAARLTQTASLSYCLILLLAMPLGTLIDKDEKDEAFL